MLEHINNMCVSRNSTAFGIGEIPNEDDEDSLQDPKVDLENDLEVTPEVKVNKKKKFKDVVRDYVMQEERGNSIGKRRSKLPLKLKKELKPASVSKTRAKLASTASAEVVPLTSKHRKLRARSLSQDNLNGNGIGGTGWNMSSSIDR